MYALMKNRKNFIKPRKWNRIVLDDVTATQQKEHDVRTSSHQKMSFISLESCVSF